MFHGIDVCKTANVTILTFSTAGLVAIYATFV